jgi:hypothetical protein
VDLAPGEYGVVLRLKNERNETVIVERIDSEPTLLGFSAGDEADELATAYVRARGGTIEGTLAILKPGEEIELPVIACDPFKATPADRKIKVTVQWRASSRSMFSERTISKTITVKDITDLRAESVRRRAHPIWGNLG